MSNTLQKNSRPVKTESKKYSELNSQNNRFESYMVTVPSVQVIVTPALKALELLTLAQSETVP